MGLPGCPLPQILSKHELRQSVRRNALPSIAKTVEISMTGADLSPRTITTPIAPGWTVPVGILFAGLNS